MVRRAVSLVMSAVGRRDLGQVLPDFVLVGAMKAGTTTLFAILSAHPGFLTPSRKEIHFFGRRYRHGEAWYRRHFPTGLELRGRITGEASTSYLSNPAVPERMYRMLPEARLIAMLRNPVDRAISNFFHEERNGREALPIEAAFAAEEERLRRHPPGTRGGLGYLGYRQRGRYAEQLEQFLRYYPREQLLAIQSEEFFANPAPVMRRIYAHLRLDPSAGARDFKARNPGGYDLSRVPAALLAELEDYFGPHNERLYRLLGCDWRWERLSRP